MRRLGRAALVCAALASGCGEKDTELVDSGLCASAPVTTWNNFGEGFLTQECQSCHGSERTGAERNGAPDMIFFDTEADALAQAQVILNAATGEDARMPPMGGVEDDDRYRLEVWLTCYAD
ncbi:MAG: hypothetical protein H6740_00700 [Alphaproteobacteria bacterium]|nr:hypothetical protein [Alphaproteobacteria bacterium]